MPKEQSIQDQQLEKIVLAEKYLRIFISAEEIKSLAQGAQSAAGLEAYYAILNQSEAYKLALSFAKLSKEKKGEAPRPSFLSEKQFTEAKKLADELEQNLWALDPGIATIINKENKVHTSHSRFSLIDAAAIATVIGLGSRDLSQDAVQGSTSLQPFTPGILSATTAALDRGIRLAMTPPMLRQGAYGASAEAADQTPDQSEKLKLKDELFEAIRTNDADRVREIFDKHPKLSREAATLDEAVEADNAAMATIIFKHRFKERFKDKTQPPNAVSEKDRLCFLKF